MLNEEELELESDIILSTSEYGPELSSVSPDWRSKRRSKITIHDTEVDIKINNRQFTVNA